MVISKKTIIFQGFRGGVQFFSRGGGSKCFTFLQKPIKLLIFLGLQSHYPISHLALQMYPMALNFGLGPQQLEKMPSDPVATTCIYLPFMLNFEFCQF